ncbi:ribosome silencing factor [Ectothiorhodospiraceae bacterium BW-2]|nr:ribosome silencing factor [Ectothiorhodospiraceae bacterium BW-2]
MQSKELAQLAVDALEDLKGNDIKVLNVIGKTSVTDTLIVASGSSSRQLQSLAESVVEKSKAAAVVPLGVEGEPSSGWILVDLGDVVVHVMLPETRAFYNLEKLWGDEAPAAAV